MRTNSHNLFIHHQQRLFFIINSDKRNLSTMSPNYSSSSSTEHEMDGVAIRLTPQQTSRAAATTTTTADQQVINAKPTLPLKSCLVHPRSRSHSHSAATQSSARPELCELTSGSRRLDSNGNDIIDAQAQRHVNSRQRRRLTFNNRTRIYLVPTLEELTTGEFAATYRTPGEDTANQQEIIRTIQAMAEHNFHDGNVLPGATDELTTRGLEHMRSSAHVRERKETKLMVTDAILTEQEEQWDCGRTVAESEEDIADVSRAVTSRSVQEAIEKAARDAAYVRRVVAHDLCQQASDMQQGRSLHYLSLAADLPLTTTTDTTGTAAGITIPRPPSFVAQATPNPWSVASTTPPNTANTTLLDQIASNASMAMSNHSKNKMSSSTTTSPMPAPPALPSATACLSRSAPL